MSRKNSDALARSLEGSPEGSAPQTRELEALAKALETVAPQRGTAGSRETGGPAVRPDFRDGLRAALVDEARIRQSQPTPLLGGLRDAVRGATERWRYSTRVAAATGATAMALSGGGVAAAAQHALPGETLYPVKLVLEDVRVALVRDDVAKGERHLTYATDRVREARLSIDAGNQDGTARALREADESTRRGAELLIRVYQEQADRAVLSRLEAFTTQQRLRITGLLPHLEGPAMSAATDSLVVLGRIDARLVALDSCPACPSAAAPPSGDVFDFSVIPPADEPFDACPCEPAPAPLRPQPADTDGPPADPAPQTPTADEPAPSDDPPADDDGVLPDLPDLPEPLDEAADVVNDLLRDVIDKALESQLGTGVLEDPLRSPQP